MHALILCLSVLGTNPADEFVIDDYEFYWTVATAGEAKLRIEKNEDSTTVYLCKSMDGISFTPEEAEKIGAALLRVNHYYAKMQNCKKKLSETVAAGEHEVIFSHHPKYGFSIIIRAKEEFISHVSLDRKAALKFSPCLIKAKRLAAFVDKKIQL
ncbi:MAG: hypothetical protein JXB10_09135 [Pirellulales bacterium]|nr:hypothetical protein [Pirellulales bacterium]